MPEPTKVYAVVSGEHSGYQVHEIYRRREDAEARAARNNSAKRFIVDGEHQVSTVSEIEDIYDGPTRANDHYRNFLQPFLDW